jgi:alanine racemase
VSDLVSSTLAVDLGAYAHNLGVVRRFLPEQCKILAVVKANAYGLGVEPIARQALEEGAAMLGVATVGEGAALREASIDAPILVLMQPPVSALSEAVRLDLRLTIGDAETGERLGEVARKQKKVAVVHCEIDTGMGRQGFMPERTLEDLVSLTRISNIDVEGLLTHFPTAETPNNSFTANQIRTFRQLLKDLDKTGIPYEMEHTANSAAIVNYPNSHFTMVRPGIMTYGVWPSEDPPEKIHLHTVVRWTSRIVSVRSLPGGANIGYRRSYKSPSPRKTALIPVGYADGYSLRLSNRGMVLVRGMRCSVTGMVSMDQIVIDVSNVNGVAEGDEVTLLGAAGGSEITIAEFAQWAETIPYDVLTGIGPRVQRVYRAET